MALETPLLGEKKEIESLVSEKREAEEKLVAAGGKDYRFLLEDCADLADIIDDIQEISSKKDEKLHAAFDTKIKFSRKIRRKAKDLKNFEQKLVFDYDSKRISLENGRKMVEIIKLCRSNKPDKARLEAERFYSLLELDERLASANETLERKKAQAERTKRTIATQLADLQWLEREPAIHAEKAARHDEGIALGNELRAMRADCILKLKSMPLPALLKKIKEERLTGLGFPGIGEDEMASLAAYLQKASLESKSAEQLLEMAGSSEQKLRHLGIDLPGFRQEVVGQRAFLSAVVSLQQGDFLSDLSPASPSLAYLARQTEAAAKAAARLAEIHKTEAEDGHEWERRKKIEEKKAELAGIDKHKLAGELGELEALENIMDGKLPEAPSQETKKRKGLIDSVFGIFR